MLLSLPRTLTDSWLYRNRNVAALIAVIILNLVTRFQYIRFDSVWCDESYSIWCAMHPVKEVVNIVKYGTDAPLYYLILHFWIKLFGIGNDAVRTLSILFETGALIFLFRLCEKASGLLFAICTSLLVITSPILLHYSLEIRAYPLVMLEVCAAFYLILQLKDQTSFRLISWLLLSLVNALMLYTHYLTVLIFPVEILTVVLFHKRNSKLIHYFIGSLVVTGLAMIPWLSQIMANIPRAGHTWLKLPSGNDLLDTLYNLLGTDGRFYGYLVFVLLLTILFIFLPTTKKSHFSWKYYFIFLSWALVPLFLDYIISQYSPVFHWRYILYAAFGFFALIAYLFSSIRIRGDLLLLVALLVAGVWYMLVPQLLGTYISEDWKKVIPIVKKEQASGSLILISAAYQCGTFSYNYDKNIYKADLKIKDLLREKKIYTVDNKDHVLLVMEREKPKNILLIQSQSYMTDPQNTVDSVLTKLYIKENRQDLPGITLTWFRHS